MLVKILIGVSAVAVIEFGWLIWAIIRFRKDHKVKLDLLRMVEEERENSEALADALTDALIRGQEYLPVIRMLYEYLWGHTYDTEKELKRMGLADNPVIRKVVEEHDNAE